MVASWLETLNKITPCEIPSLKYNTLCEILQRLLRDTSETGEPSQVPRCSSCLINPIGEDIPTIFSETLGYFGNEDR